MSSDSPIPPTQSINDTTTMLPIPAVAFLGVVAGVGIIGNLFIIGSICLYKKLRNRGNVFIVNLAIADLIIVAYIMPVGLTTSQFDDNPFSHTMCEVNAFLIMLSCGVSTQSLMLVALERYFHICRMNLYRKAFTTKLIVLYIFLIWIYTAIWTAQGWTGWTFYIYGINIYLCVFSPKPSIAYDVCVAFFGMVLPMIVLSICYYKIFKKVAASRKALNAHRKKADVQSGTGEDLRLHQPEAEKQATREYQLVVMLFTIVIVYSLCWIPASIVLVGSGVWKSLPPIANLIAMWLGLSNSAVNAIIYGLLNSQFRRGYWLLLSGIFCCGKQEKSCSSTGSTNIGIKQDSSSNNQSNSGEKHSQSPAHVASSSQTSFNTRSGASSVNTDTTSPDSNQALISNGGSPSSLQPIQYKEEPVSGARSLKERGMHVTNHDQKTSEGDNLSVAPVDSEKVTSTMMSDMYMSSTTSTLTQTGSQASLIRHSVGTVNGSFVPTVIRHDDYPRPNQFSIPKGLNSHSPLPAIKLSTGFGDREVSGKRGNASSVGELSMTNVILETKM